MPILFLGIPLLAVVTLNLFTWANRKSAFLAAMAASVCQLGLAAYDMVRCFLTGEEMTSTFFGTFSVDLFTAVVLFLIALICCVTLLVAGELVKSHRFTFGGVMLLLMMGMNGVVMVRDLFSLYAFIEITGASSFLLIAIDSTQDELEGAFKYYLMSALATAMMLGALAVFFLLVGDTSFAAVSAYIQGHAGEHPTMLMGALVLYTAAIAIKSGAVPFHSWVPDAHSSAPSPVSVVLAGIVIKVSGVYTMMRLYRDVFAYDSRIASVMLVLGLASVIVGALGALGQTDIKRMLAFSSVSQIGYIVLGAATGSPIGFVGAMMHFFNHATFKSLLFVDAAAILHETHTRNMDEMGGLAERMPLTGLTSVIGLLSMAGIPPLSGFWSKLLIIIALWQVSSPVALAALLASVLTLTYFLVLQKKVFYGKLNPKLAGARECRGRLRFVQVALAAVNVLAGLAFPVVLLLLQNSGMI